MTQQMQIRDLAARGLSPTEIKETTGFSYPTIRKYLAKDDFSPQRPVKRAEDSILDPYKAEIARMLEEDKRAYHKQRHTAKRVHRRLVDEHGFEGSYSTVQRYVKELRAQAKLAAAKGPFVDLEWPAGTMQVDFGQADFEYRGRLSRMHYLAVSFPQSNHGLAQLFGDERAAEEATDGQFEFLCSLLAGEYELRASNKIARLRRQACFPFTKGFEDFSWEGVEFPADFSREELLSCGFVDRKENVVLYGGSGNGKTHTAVALGLTACSQGRRVLFRETSKLILELSAAHQEGRLKQKLDALEKCDLIILDEWGYIPCDPDGAKLLFRVISMCYEKISLLFTTNIDFSRWGAIFSDADMAGAMLDRVIHHGRLVTYDRESYRMRNSLMRADAAAS